MFKYLLVLALLTSVISCKNQKEEKKDDRLNPTDPVGEARELSTNEEELVKTACESLRDKRNYLSTLLDNSLKMTIAVSDKNCTDRGLTTPVTINASVAGNSTGEFRLESAYRGSRFSDMIVDSKGMAYPLCRNFFNGAKLENVISFDGVKYKYRVLNQQKHTILEVATYLNDSAPSSIEQAYIIKGGTINGVDMIGFVEQRTKSVKCSTGGERVIRHTMQSISE